MVPPPVDAPLLVLCGPTAVGKTAAALALAERVRGEIVAADSRTIYRGMDIGTAKPTAAQRARVPHHCLDLAAPDEVVTLAAYRHQALAAIADIRGRGGRPLLVGGTGLYIRAVVEGFTIPAVAPDRMLRAQLEDQEAAQPGWLHARLLAVDPAAAARIHPRNVRRLVRALEVHAHTGRPISALQGRVAVTGEVAQIGLTMERGALYRRIDERVEAQLASGLLEEVRGLLARRYDRALPAMQGLGYKELIAFLDGAVPYAEAVRRLKRNTRRFARRQYTWFRRDARIRWMPVDDLAPEAVADAIVRMLQ